MQKFPEIINTNPRAFGDEQCTVILPTRAKIATENTAVARTSNRREEENDC